MAGSGMVTMSPGSWEALVDGETCGHALGPGRELPSQQQRLLSD